MEGFIAGALLVAIAIGLVIWLRNRKSEREAQPRRGAVRGRDRDEPAANEEAKEEEEGRGDRGRGGARARRRLRSAGPSPAALPLRAPAAPADDGRGSQHARTHARGDRGHRKRGRPGAVDGAGKMALAMEGIRDVIPGGPPTMRRSSRASSFECPRPQRCRRLISSRWSGRRARRATSSWRSATQPCLCEWTEDAHVNLGPIEADESTFLAAVRRVSPSRVARDTGGAPPATIESPFFRVPSHSRRAGREP